MTQMLQQRLFSVQAPPPRLGSNQRDVLVWIDRYGSIRTRIAGRIVYRNRGVNPNRVDKMWLESAGWRVLISLRRRGLVRRDHGGNWQRRIPR